MLCEDPDHSNYLYARRLRSGSVWCRWPSFLFTKCENTAIFLSMYMLIHGVGAFDGVIFRGMVSGRACAPALKLFQVHCSQQ